MYHSRRVEWLFLECSRWRWLGKIPSRESLSSVFVCETRSPSFHCVFLLDYSWRQGAALFQQFYILALIQTTWNREGPLFTPDQCRALAYLLFSKEMKTEEVKYVYQSEGPLLMPKTKNGAVYQETTVSNRAKDVKNQQAHCCWPSHLFSRLRLVLSCLAIMACLVVIAVNYLVLSPYFVAVLYNQSILSIRSGISCRHSTRPESFAGVDD